MVPDPPFSSPVSSASSLAPSESLSSFFSDDRLTAGLVGCCFPATASLSDNTMGSSSIVSSQESFRRLFIGVCATDKSSSRALALAIQAWLSSPSSPSLLLSLPSSCASSWVVRCDGPSSISSSLPSCCDTAAFQRLRPTALGIGRCGGRPLSPSRLDSEAAAAAGGAGAISSPTF